MRELKQAGAVEIFMEYEHGDAKVKSQQAQMFAQAQAGDTVIVLEVSRLARSTQQLCEIIDTVREKHLRLVIVGSITLDCRRNPEGRLSTVICGRPIFTPLLAAFAIPDRTRLRIIARSN